MESVGLLGDNAIARVALALPVRTGVTGGATPRKNGRPAQSYSLGGPQASMRGNLSEASCASTAINGRSTRTLVRRYPDSGNSLKADSAPACCRSEPSPHTSPHRSALTAAARCCSSSFGNIWPSIDAYRHEAD